MQGFIDGILKMPQSEDVFKIRENILLSLEYGDYDIIKNLQRDILKYSNYFNAIISGYFKKQSNIVILKEMYMEYSKLISDSSGKNSTMKAPSFNTLCFSLKSF